MGAEYIDIDTIASYMKFALLEPVPIEFAAIEQAAEDAAYTLSIFELQLRGHTFAMDCDTCGKEVLALRVLATGQVLELTGEVPADTDLLITASVTGWSGEHPLLEVIKSEDL